MARTAARKLADDTVIFQDGSAVHLIVWDVGKSARYPMGFKYRYFYVKDGTVVVGYDNHFPKGPHRHVEGREEPYALESREKVLEDFKEDVRRAGGVWP